MTILDRIVRDTRALTARRKAEVPVARLETYPSYTAPTLSLADALRGKHLSVIAEIKKASPSKGVIRADFDVRDLARQYSRSGAAAISVLTEPLHFQGALDHLPLARQTSDLPLLRKDFIIDPYQLVEARAYGADAVLLIAAVLDRVQLFDLHQAAEALGLSCLVEVYEPGELDKLNLDQIKILGVNNRDLRTFEVDLDHSLRVFNDVPASLVRVSESGLRTPEDLAYLHRHGMDAVLIGETLMRHPRPGAALRTLIDESRALVAGAPPLPLTA